MSSRDDVATPIGQRLSIGLSSIIGVTALPGQNCLIIKGLSFTTLEIGGATLLWGNGYPLGQGEIVSWNGSAVFYLAAAGSTATVALFRGRSIGFENV